MEFKYSKNILEEDNMGDAFVMVKLKETVSLQDFERFMGDHLAGYSNLIAMFTPIPGDKVLVVLNTSKPVVMRPIFDKLREMAVVLGEYDNLSGYHTEPVYAYVLDLTKVTSAAARSFIADEIALDSKTIPGIVDIMVFYSPAGYYTVQIWTETALTTEDRAAHRKHLSIVSYVMGANLVYEYFSI